MTAPKTLTQRRLHKAFLRYHDPANWQILREALVRLGRKDLIGGGPEHLVPWHDHAPPPRPAKPFATQHPRRS